MHLRIFRKLKAVLDLFAVFLDRM